MEFQMFLESNFRNVRVTGAEFPTPPLIGFCASLLSMIQVAAMALILLGPQLFTMLGFSRVPAWYISVKDYGIQLGFVVFLVLPQILGRFATSGAFEIYLQDGSATKTLWSRLETGAFPNAEQLTQIMEGVGIKSIGR